MNKNFVYVLFWFAGFAFSQNIKTMKSKYRRFIRYSIALLVCCLFTSCYSVRLKNVYGDPMPDPVSDRTDYYRMMKVNEIVDSYLLKP